MDHRAVALLAAALLAVAVASQVEGQQQHGAPSDGLHGEGASAGRDVAGSTRRRRGLDVENVEYQAWSKILHFIDDVSVRGGYFHEFQQRTSGAINARGELRINWNFFGSGRSYTSALQELKSFHTVMKTAKTGGSFDAVTARTYDIRKAKKRTAGDFEREVCIQEKRIVDYRDQRRGRDQGHQHAFENWTGAHADCLAARSAMLTYQSGQNQQAKEADDDYRDDTGFSRSRNGKHV